MSTKQNNLRSILLVGAALLLTLFTGILAAVPLRVLRLSIGRGPFFLLGSGLALVLAGTGFHWTGLFFLSLVIVTGVYREAEVQKLTFFKGGLLALAAGWCCLALGGYSWVTRQGAEWMVTLEGALVKYMETVGQGRFSELGIEAKDIIAQAPSAVFIVLLVSLTLSLVLEKRLLGLAKWTHVEKPERASLLKFRLPDPLIWLFILSMPAAFLDVESQMLQGLGLNLLNISVALYFLQGISVISWFFVNFKVSVFWRVFWLVFLVMQLSLFVSVVGLLDYWVNFRSRYSNRAAQAKKTS